MARPITAKDRERVRRLHAEGKTRNQIAREIGRSGSTVSKIAEALGLTFERGAEVLAATEARQADLAALRAGLALDLTRDAMRLREQLWQPARVFAFGGKDNEYAEEWHPEPPPADKRALLGAAGMAIDRSLKLAPIDSGGDADQVRSMLGSLGEAIATAFRDDDQDQGDGGGDDGG